MGWSESYPGRIWNAVSKYGVVAGLQDSLARWALRRFRKVPDVMAEYAWILNKECPAALARPCSGPLRINWLIPYVGKASGGLLGMFRAIHQLEQWGHQQRIYIVGRSPMTAAESSEIMRKYYFPIQAEIELFHGTVADSDALVATLWNTAYTARSISNTARRFYFAQDLEHLFFAPGGLSEFVKQTYCWGFYGVTLGQWIANVLGKEFGMECSAFGFSYDRDTYSPQGISHSKNGKKRVLFYARPSTERRGFELGILALALVAKKVPDVEVVLIGFSPGPAQFPFRAVLPGIVSPSELAAWYRSCDAALVLSFTNLSLLPLELMACSCPVVSNTGANVEWLLTKENTQLAEPTPEGLANAILTLLYDDDLRARKAAAGLAFAETTDWTSEIMKIERAFYLGLDLSPPERPHVS